jgi:hypothetical protein
MHGYEEEGVPHATTAEDLREILGCWTRVDILIGLSGPVMDASALAAALHLTSNLLSNHLRVLRLRLVEYERDGLHPSRLTVPIRFRCRA